MPLIVVSGAKESGKSFFVNQLQSHWRGDTLIRRLTTPDNATVAAMIRADIDILRNDDRVLIVWENSWLTTQVAATQGQYSKSEAGLPFFAEWKFGRAIQTLGERILIDPVDDPKNYFKEKDRTVHKGYASGFGWTIIENDFTDSLVTEAAAAIERAAKIPFRYWPPVYSGPADASVVFVDDRSWFRRGRDASPIALTLSAPSQEKWAENIRLWALRFGWTDAMAVPTSVLRDVPHLVAFTDTAYNWVKNHVGRPDVERVPGYADWREAGKVEKEMLIAELQMTMEVFSR